MISFCVVEDNLEERQKFLAFMEKCAKEYNFNYEIDIFSSSEEYLFKHKDNYNAVFLDIQLPKMNGMELANEIRKSNQTSLIIFITNMAQYAIKGYEVQAFDFIVKPLKEELFIMKMGRIIERINLDNDDKISFSINRQTKVFLFKEILYVCVSNHNLEIVTKHEIYKTRAQLVAVEDSFFKHSFFKVSSYALVNLEYVKGMDHDDILVDKYRVRVSRPRKKEFLKVLGTFLGND